MAKKETLDAYMRISTRVKEALDEVRGSVSASDYIDRMLMALKNLGIDPLCDLLKQQSDTSTILKRIEDMIKILRSIEQNSLNPLLKSIHKEPNIDEEKALSETMLKNKDLESLLSDLRRKNRELVKEIQEKEKTINNIRSKVRQYCDKNKLKKSFLGNNYMVTSSFFDDIMKIVDNDL